MGWRQPRFGIGEETRQRSHGRNRTARQSVVADQLPAFTTEECRNYFEAPGYDPDYVNSLASVAPGADLLLRLMTLVSGLGLRECEA